MQMTHIYFLECLVKKLTICSSYFRIIKNSAGKRLILISQQLDSVGEPQMNPKLNGARSWE
ncbi:hypothetical protein LINPERHAP1_LOCUS27826 [Linum perenne]